MFSIHGWSACEPCRAQEDVVVLMGDGVYASPKDQVYAIDSDLKARGLSLDDSLKHAISYAEFVKLTETHHPSVSWND